jgi:hypothetical protein
MRPVDWEFGDIVAISIVAMLCGFFFSTGVALFVLFLTL